MRINKKARETVKAVIKALKAHGVKKVTVTPTGSGHLMLAYWHDGQLHKTVVANSSSCFRNRKNAIADATRTFRRENNVDSRQTL